MIPPARSESVDAEGGDSVSAALARKGTWPDDMLAHAEFGHIIFHGWTGYRTSSCTQGALRTEVKPQTPAQQR